MLTIQKLVKADDPKAKMLFLCQAKDLPDIKTACLAAKAMSEGWKPKMAEEGIYVYDTTTNVVEHKFENGELVW